MVKGLSKKHHESKKTNIMFNTQRDFITTSVIQKLDEGKGKQLQPLEFLHNGGYIQKYSLLQNNPGFQFQIDSELKLDGGNLQNFKQALTRKAQI